MQLLGRFNAFLKSVILRVNEARDQGTDHNRFAFYDHSKTLITSPPETLSVDEKNVKVYPIFNVTSLIFLTNLGAHKNEPNCAHFYGPTKCAG